jgi:MOSC domain-containing protein YiiM
MSKEASCADLESQVELRPDLLKRAAGRWGVVAGIFIGPEAGKLMVGVPEVRARAGAGLEGDRYASGAGTFSNGHPNTQLTLVEEEALAAAERDYGVTVAGAETRRNLLTCGISLNHLVGREFHIGDVRLRGLKLCEPCGYLEKLTGKEVIKTLRHRGGLRAEILVDGVIKVGDLITERE